MVVAVCVGLWRFVLVFGGLCWFVAVCVGLWRFFMVCGSLWSLSAYCYV